MVHAQLGDRTRGAKRGHSKGEELGSIQKSSNILTYQFSNSFFFFNLRNYRHNYCFIHNNINQGELSEKEKMVAVVRVEEGVVTGEGCWGRRVGGSFLKG